MTLRFTASSGALACLLSCAMCYSDLLPKACSLLPQALWPGFLPRSFLSLFLFPSQVRLLIPASTELSGQGPIPAHCFLRFLSLPGSASDLLTYGSSHGLPSFPPPFLPRAPPDLPARVTSTRGSLPARCPLAQVPTLSSLPSVCHLAAHLPHSCQLCS